MKKSILCIVLGVLAASGAVSAMVDDAVLKFKGGIGSQPFASVCVTVNVPEVETVMLCVVSALDHTLPVA